MPVNQNYLAEFEYESIYHIYNKTNNKELLFRSDENYLYFLILYAKYISPFAETFAWNLLPNHFHFMLRIKKEKDIEKHIINLPLDIQTKTEKLYLINKDLNTLMENEFKRFFISYAMAFNNLYNRTGNLFYRTFKRVNVTNDTQFTQALIYIHANAQKHGLVKRFDQYKWTSYHSLISEKSTKLLRNEIFEWFGSKESFIKLQYELTEYYYSVEGSLEEDDF
jgi:putative transposase